MAKNTASIEFRSNDKLLFSLDEMERCREGADSQKKVGTLSLRCMLLVTQQGVFSSSHSAVLSHYFRGVHWSQLNCII